MASRHAVLRRLRAREHCVGLRGPHLDIHPTTSPPAARPSRALAARPTRWSSIDVESSIYPVAGVRTQRTTLYRCSEGETFDDGGVHSRRSGPRESRQGHLRRPAMSRPRSGPRETQLTPSSFGHSMNVAEIIHRHSSLDLRIIVQTRVESLHDIGSSILFVLAVWSGPSIASLQETDRTLGHPALETTSARLRHRRASRRAAQEPRTTARRRGDVLGPRRDHPGLAYRLQAGRLVGDREPRLQSASPAIVGVPRA